MIMRDLIWIALFKPLVLLIDDVMEVEMVDEDAVPLKKQKGPERCKFWPVCKSGDECPYHHPTTQCKWVILLIIWKGDNWPFSLLILHVLFFFVSFCPWRTFPSCRFGEKCLFVHPNCKYDARCTKPDCPFTHVSRRGQAAPPPKPGTQTFIMSPPGTIINQMLALVLQSHAVCRTSGCFSNWTVCVPSSAASANHERVSLLPRLQEDGLPVLSSQGKAFLSAVVDI